MNKFYSILTARYSDQKLLFVFICFYYLFFSIIIRYFVYFSESMNFFGNDSLLFHHIAIQLCYFIETGDFDFSISKEGSAVLFEYCAEPIENKYYILYQYIYQFPAVITAAIYFVFRLHDPLLINLTNILLHSISTTLLYLFFLRVSKERISSLFAILVVGFFPFNFLTVIPISKGIYYYFGFSMFCYSLTTKRKFIFLFLSLAVLVISRPSYFFNLTHHEFSNILSADFLNFPQGSLFDTINARLDKVAKTLIKIRNTKNVLASSSNFDYSGLPKTGKEMIEYIPKGLCIGLFKPYPNEWFSVNRGFFFFISSIEMFFIYIGLFFLPFTLFRWRKSKNLITISIVCLLAIIVYGTVSYNLGYLYRTRFIFIGTLAGIGLMYIPIFISVINSYVIYFRQLFWKNCINIINPTNV